MTLWKTVDRWRYSYFDPDIDPQEVPVFSSLLEIWQSKRRDRKVPAWRDFDFYDFTGWHGKLTVYNISYDPFDYVVRLSGTYIDQLYQRSMKGMTLADMTSIAVQNTNAIEFYEMACKNLYVTHTIGPLNVRELDYKAVEYMEMPLSDDGVRATHTIEAAIPIRYD